LFFESLQVHVHTVGVTHCLNILERLYYLKARGAEGMEPGFKAFLMFNCPRGSLISNLTFVQNDPTTFVFDNQYYINAEMAMDPRTAGIVQHFASGQEGFFRGFSSAFLKLSSSVVLTGSQGIIRKTCNELY
jgi:peroxidase